VCVFSFVFVVYLGLQLTHVQGKAGRGKRNSAASGGKVKDVGCLVCVCVSYACFQW